MGRSGITGVLASAIISSMKQSVRRAAREAKKGRVRQEKLEQVRSMVESAKAEIKKEEDYVNNLISLHKIHRDVMNWEQIQNSSAPVLPERSDINERFTRNEREQYVPGFFDKFFRRVDLIIKSKDNAIEQGRQKDEEKYRKRIDRYKKKYSIWREQVDLATGILAENLETYKKVLQVYDLGERTKEAGRLLSVKIPHSDIIVVELNDIAEEVLPEKQAVASKTGRLRYKSFTKAAYYDLYQKYVCSSAIRIAREIQSLLPVETVVVNLWGKVIDKVTLCKKRCLILTAAITRKEINLTKVEEINPVEIVSKMTHNMKFKKNKGFEKVDKLDSR